MKRLPTIEEVEAMLTKSEILEAVAELVIEDLETGEREKRR